MVARRIIAITGGAGFIGGALVRAHLQRGDEVRVLSRRRQQDGGGVRYFQVDLSTPTADLRSFVDGVDLLYHCAGELYDESKIVALHVGGTQRLLDAAVGTVGRWVQLSSVGAYGPRHSGIVNESTSERPIGLYERTKTEADRLLSAAAMKSGMEFVLLRPSIVFGESMTNRSLEQMAHMIRKGLFFYVGCDARVNYVHVDDVVAALLLCGKKREAIGKTFVLSDSVMLEQMVQALAEGLGVKAPSLRLPMRPVHLLVKLLDRLPNFPLTKNRLDALTGHCLYDSSSIVGELGFNFQVRLDKAFYCYAKSIK